MDSDGAGLVQALGDHHVAERAVQSGHLDHVEALVRPVDVPWESTADHSNISMDGCVCVGVE